MDAVDKMLDDGKVAQRAPQPIPTERMMFDGNFARTVQIVGHQPITGFPFSVGGNTVGNGVKWKV